MKLKEISTREKMPCKFEECIIYVEFEGCTDSAVYYGYHDGEKWVGVMPWDTCECCGGVDLSEIHGDVVYWMPFPIAEQFKKLDC